MEELRSTDVLDREILEDARKKARRILKTADDAASAGEAAWEKKKQETLEELKKKYAARLDQGRKEIMARLPLDKQRLRSRHIESLLHSAMDEFLTALPESSTTALLERELTLRAEELSASEPAPGEGGGSGFKVLFRGISEAQAASLVEKIFPAAGGSGEERLFERAAPGSALSGSFPALLVETPWVRLSVSVDAAAASLLRDKRAELVTALLGEGALEESAGISGLEENHA